METVVGDGLFRPFTPLLVSLTNTLLRIRDDKINDHRSATGETSRGASVKVFARHRAHEGQLHVRVRIDATRHHILACGVHYFTICGRFKILTYSFDCSIAAQYISTQCVIGCDDGSTFD